MKFSKSTTLLFSAISSAVHDISTAQSVEPSCSGDEALVELSAITKNINNTDLGGDYDPFGLSLALLDTTNGNVTFDCTNCKFIVDGLESSYNDTMTSYEQKKCLPKDHCHRFLLGTNEERWRGERIIDYFETFTLKWDGESLLGDFNAYSFGRIDFGGCDPTTCSPEEAEFEFFLTNNENTMIQDVAWNVTGSDGMVLYSDVAPVNTSSFIHAIECLPKDDCLTFHIEKPFDTFYSLRYDGVIYADGKLEAFYPEGKKVYFGDCRAEHVCTEESDSYFQAQLNFLDSFIHNGTEVYALADTEINWVLVQDRSVYATVVDNFFKDFDGYEFGESYSVGRCINMTECSQFVINTDVLVGLESYYVFEEKEELKERVTHAEDDDKEFAGYEFGSTTTTGTKGCPANVWAEDVGQSAAGLKSLTGWFLAVVLVMMYSV